MQSGKGDDNNRGCIVISESFLYVGSRRKKSNAKDKGIPRVSAPSLRDVSKLQSSDPLLRERLWLKVCADIYSRRYKVHDVLEPLASAASIDSKSLDVELVALHIDWANELLSVSEKLSYGAFIVNRLSKNFTCE